jgi:hypothetical protein
LNKRGFSRAKITYQSDQVAGLEQRTEPHAHPPGLFCASANDLQ